MRLIDADGLREDIETIDYTDCNNYYDTVDFIDDAPTIEAEPVRHGKWEFAGDGIVGCTSCGETYHSRYVVPRNYCPNCGARMDLGGRK